MGLVRRSGVVETLGSFWVVDDQTGCEPAVLTMMLERVNQPVVLESFLWFAKPQISREIPRYAWTAATASPGCAVVTAPCRPLDLSIPGSAGPSTSFGVSCQAVVSRVRNHGSRQPKEGVTPACRRVAPACFPCCCRARSFLLGVCSLLCCREYD